MLQTYAALRRAGLVALDLKTVAIAFAAVALCPPPALAQRPLGIDVSYWQGTAGISQTTWNNIYAEGRRFAFVRCSHYGSTGGDPDPSFPANMTRARNAGLLVGAYHYAKPTLRSPQDEANTFVTYATQYWTGWTQYGPNFISNGFLRPVLDLEEGAGQVPVGANNLANWANAWINAVQQQTGIEAIVYCNTNYASNYLNGGTPSLANRTLWLAKWDCPSDPLTANPAGSNPDGIWSGWAFWQYCVQSSPPVAGISPIDVDVFNGTMTQLGNYLIGPLPPVIVLDPPTLNVKGVPGSNVSPGEMTVANDTSVLRQTLNYTITDNVSWLSVSPSSGSTSGPPNPHTINFNTTALAVGQYTGTITVSGTGALNSPQQLVVNLRVRIPADVDTDGDVDVTDFGFIQTCLGSPNVAPPPGCVSADADEDNDVDATDVTKWIECANGPENPPAPGCS